MAVPKLRFPEFNEEWKEKEIFSLSEKLLAGGTPNTSKREFWENGDIPWISSGEIHKKRIKSVDKYITTEGYQNSSTKMIPINSVLIALAGQGKTRATTAINKIELCTNQSLATIMPNKNKLDYEYLFYYLEKNYEKLRALSSLEGGRGGLNIKLIKSFKINFPKLSEQHKIAFFLSKLDEKIGFIENT